MPMYYVPMSMTPPHGVHEMDSSHGHGHGFVDPQHMQHGGVENGASAASGGGGGSGILNFIRKSASTKKDGGGVERYG